MRTCRSCGRSYRPSSGHHECPACRSRDECACGNPKQVKSRTCAACRRHEGPFNGAWRGGRAMHRAGYVMVHAPEHPRVRRTKYVFEHILVMEDMLGRYLLPDETVQHRNGVKDDNRPENPNCGSAHNRAASERATPLPGRRRSSRGTRTFREPSHLQQRCDNPCTATLLEVRGFEPLSSGDRMGLLRAQPTERSRLEAPVGGGPLGQPGKGVPHRPPGGTAEVSLLSDARPSIAGTRGERLPRD